VRLYVDTSNGHDTGIAFANPGNSAVTVTFSTAFIDGIGQGANYSPFTLPAGGHTAKFIGELTGFWPAATRGVVEISSTAPIATLTMRSLVNQRGEFLLTTFPVADMNSPAPVPVFPQIADGDGYRTEVVLISPQESIAAATVEFYDSQGQPLSVRP
jgi:hypothetical protein